MCSVASRIFILLLGLGCALARVDASEPTLQPQPVVTPQVISLFDQAILLAPDGSLWAWGGTDSRMVATFGTPTTTPTPTRIGTAQNWRRATASDSQVLGIKDDGSLWGWGYFLPASGQLISSPRQIGTATNWSDICVGAGHAVALQKDESLWAWGQNDHGQVGDDSRNDRTEPVRISEARWTAITAGSFNGFGLREDGIVWGWGLAFSEDGKDYLRPRQLDPDTQWRSISAGSYHLLGLKKDGSLWIMGQNVQWAFPKAQPATFLQLGHDRDWIEIHSGQGHYLARKSDGTWWGYLWKPAALGKTTTRWFPTRLPFSLRPWAVAAGQTCVYLDKDGALWTWGPRLGYLYPSQATNQIERAVIKVKQTLPEALQLYINSDLPVDAVPHRIWQVPTGE
jgi:alpha-tubulin suppressor-like RCC1 family protein